MAAPKQLKSTIEKQEKFSSIFSFARTKSGMVSNEANHHHRFQHPVLPHPPPVAISARHAIAHQFNEKTLENLFGRQEDFRFPSIDCRTPKWHLAGWCWVFIEYLLLFLWWRFIIIIGIIIIIINFSFQFVPMAVFSVYFVSSVRLFPIRWYYKRFGRLIAWNWMKNVTFLTSSICSY